RGPRDGHSRHRVANRRDALAEGRRPRRTGRWHGHCETTVKQEKGETMSKTRSSKTGSKDQGLMRTVLEELQNLAGTMDPDFSFFSGSMSGIMHTFRLGPATVVHGLARVGAVEDARALIARVKSSSRRAPLRALAVALAERGEAAAARKAALGLPASRPDCAWRAPFQGAHALPPPRPGPAPSARRGMGPRSWTMPRSRPELWPTSPSSWPRLRSATSPMPASCPSRSPTTAGWAWPTCSPAPGTSAWGRRLPRTRP